MIEIVECPACGSTDLVPHLRCHDHTVSHETFQLVRCTSCDIVITSPQPNPEDLPRYYESEEYISHSGKTTGLSSFYRVARSYNLQWKRTLLNKFANRRSVLDYGCGTGEFLSLLKEYSWEIHGVEPSSIARGKATSNTKTAIHETLDEISEDIRFNVITLWHVLEHIPDLKQKLIMLLQRLDQDGTMVLAVPNYQSPDASTYKENWAGYDVPRHLWHFSKQSMKRLVEQSGAKIVSIIPMRLDAYYVSVLSEKYQHGNQLTLIRMAAGFFAGLRSNMKASADNYSSLVYIVKKS